MRWILAVGLSLASASAASATPADDFGLLIEGPWGQVGADWQRLTGALAKNSCPDGGIKAKDTIGLFGDGGAMWIEPALAGALNVYDGSLAPRLFALVRMDGSSSAIYREGGGDRRLRLEGADRLSLEREPGLPGAPPARFERCAVKK